MTTTTAKGRTFQLTRADDPFPMLEADLISRGYDGTIWYGLSAPVGRQRVTISGIFYRTVNGRFDPALLA
jgi:hypothetical protein